MLRAVLFRVLSICDTGFLGVLAAKGLLERVLSTPDSGKSVEKTGSQCFVESASVMMTASMEVWN